MLQSNTVEMKCQADARMKFIEVFLARLVSGEYAHHQEH